MDKLKRIEKYLFDFFSNRYEHIDIFYRSTHRDRCTGIYNLKDGPRIMDLLISIHGNIEELYYYEHLVPHKFATPEALLRSLNCFKRYLNDNQELLDKNYKDALTSYIIYDTQKIKDELIEMIDYAKKLYDYEDTLIPYQELRYKLITKNVPDFINILKSIMASVSYAITKTLEGYFHSNVHLTLKLLGFDIISEELTNIGRIDAVIRFSDTIYILEFKFANDENLSSEALQQIKDKNILKNFLLKIKILLPLALASAKRQKTLMDMSLKKLKNNTSLQQIRFRWVRSTNDEAAVGVYRVLIS